MYAQSLIGTLLLGRYRVEDVLGIGGMGVVVRAVHTDLDTQVAIKFLLPNMVESPSVVQRFLREAQATVKLKSAHVAKVIDVGKLPDGAPFMVMEYLSGADLGQVLKAHGAQPPMVACDLMLQICEGMAEAHALGIVHRDVKPSNFFVTRNPDGSPLVKILDFGISKVPMNGDMQLTGTQSMVGTPAYMAPEHMRAASRADARSDLWSMGVVLYQLLANRLPFDGESYADLCLKVAMELPAPLQVVLPPGLGEVVLRCLEKDPAQRFQSVAQLAYALAPYCSDPVVASVAAERCARILEAPRGPRAPTLGAGESLGIPSTGQHAPYGYPSGHQSGHQSHSSHLRSQSSHLRSHPSSLSGGAGEVQQGGAKKSRLALYGVGAAMVLVLGVGLGVFAAGGSGAGGASDVATEVAPSAAPVAPAVAPAAKRDAPAAAPTPAADAAPVAPAAEAKADEPPQLQGGAEPDPEPAAKADDKAAEAKADDKADAEPADAKPADAKPADAKPAEPKRSDAQADEAKPAKPKVTKPKPKKKPADLFNSRE